MSGDEVEIHFAALPQSDLLPENIPLDILYEDQDILVINKPVGMVVHPAPGHWTGTFVNALLHHCKSWQGTETLRPGIVHRLDKETSGVLVAAKTPLAHQRLIEAFSQRKVKKEYLVICVGNPGTKEIDAPIGRHPVHRKMMTVVEEGGRVAISRCQTIATDGKLSIVRIQPETGRTHQIRVHLKHVGTPVLGDSTYGNPQVNKSYGAIRQLLHAESLSFQHPIEGRLMTFQAPIPGDIQVFMTKIKK